MTAFEKPAIDLTYTAWEREVGEFRIAGTWFRHDDNNTEPCLFIRPAKGLVAGAKPAVVLLSSAYLYVDPRNAAATIRSLALGMGMEGITQWTKLADLINDHISDLISIPPDRRKREAIGDVEVTIGGRRRTGELLE